MDDSPRRLPLQALVAAALLAAALPAAAMQDAADPPPATTEPTTDSVAAAARPPSPPPDPTPTIRTPPPRDQRGRVIQPDEPTALAFKAVTLEQMLPFIMEATGKTVIPMPDLLARKITIVNDQRIPRTRALDLVFFALYQNSIAVVETDDYILLRDIAEVTRQDVPVLGPDTSTLDRSDLGTIVQKVYAFKNARAGNIGEILEDSLPDFAKKYIVDNDSNQIVVIGNVALLQRIEHVVNALDVPGALDLETQTYRLRWADSEKIAQNIRDLFLADDASRAQQAAQQQQFGGFRGFGQQEQQQRRRGQPAVTSANMRVTANTQQNSVTVLAERRVLDQIETAIRDEWDTPLPPELVAPRTYDLINSDAVKVRNLLDSMFGRGSPASAATPAPAGQQRPGGQQQQQSTGTSQGVGRLAGQFSFEAFPDANRLVVIAKSPDYLDEIDKIIAELDRPNIAGLPLIIELKHASAEELAEQINALLALEGTLATIQRQESGLSTDSATTSPFSTAGATTTSPTADPAQTTALTLSFWWQRARPPTDSTGSSNLVGRIRIVPVWRQNALMILSPPEYKAPLANLIEQLDSPGRQVLISAIVAEISLENATALGLRWSSSNITPTNPDNAISIGSAFQGTKNEFINSLFDTSVLSTTANVNLLIQALAQKTAINILSEPRIFTSDNQEAEFFDGQDIPFITNSQTGVNNNLIQSFDYRAVGIQLRVRPRITVKKDVDLRINLELSSIQPSQTLFGGFIVDRRETTTHLIVKDRQTVVISGIIRREESKIVRKIPLLGDIPFIGHIFRSTDTQRSNKELIAFITPIVVENTDAADAVFHPNIERLQDIRSDFKEPQPPAKTTPIPPSPPPSDAPADQG